MQFVEEQSVFKAARITGPKHNYLGLAFHPDDKDIGFLVESLKDEQGERALSEEEVCQYVVAGVSAANKKLGTRHRVRLIQYIRSDSPPECVYEEMARSIVIRMSTQDNFDS